MAGEDYQYQAGGDYREAGPPFVDLRGDYQIPTQGLDYQTQAAGEDYRSDQWGQWSRCTQGRKTKHRCKQREDLCETLLCKPKAFGPRGDYQIQAPGPEGEDYKPQIDRHRPGCPRKQPVMGRACKPLPSPQSIRCNYGRECCCGKCHHSFVAQCLPNGRYGSSWVGYNTDVCLSPNCGQTGCPKKEPATGSPCSVPEGVTCSFGSVCCCGKCHSSFQAKCDPKYGWIGLNTDACFFANCRNNKA